VGLTLPALEINTIHMRAKQNYVVYYVLLSSRLSGLSSLLLLNSLT